MTKAKGVHRKKQSRKRSSQANPYNKALAREANKYLGTAFNTRKKYLSTYAVTKLNKFQALGLVNGRMFDVGMDAPALTAIPVPKNLRKKILESGYQTIRTPKKGLQILVSNEPDTVKRFKKRLSKGMVTGVSRLGRMGIEEVQIPFEINTFGKLMNALDLGEIEELKHDDERFAFRLFGKNSHVSFRDADELRKYLEHYKFVTDSMENARPEEAQEQFQHFELMRLKEYPWRNSPFDPTWKYRRKRIRAQRKFKNVLDMRRKKEAQLNYEEQLERDKERKRAKRDQMTAEELDRLRQRQRQAQRRWRQKQQDK